MSSDLFPEPEELLEDEGLQDIIDVLLPRPSGRSWEEQKKELRERRERQKMLSEMTYLERWEFLRRERGEWGSGAEIDLSEPVVSDSAATAIRNREDLSEINVDGWDADDYYEAMDDQFYGL